MVTQKLGAPKRNEYIFFYQVNLEGSTIPHPLRPLVIDLVLDLANFYLPKLFKVLKC